MMNSISGSSTTSGLPLDVKTGDHIDLTLEDFEDEDLSDILHENGLQLSSYSNNNFKLSYKIFHSQRRKNGKVKESGQNKRRDNKHFHRAASESDAGIDFRGKTCTRPRPTTLRFFAEPARPGPLPSSCLIDQARQRYNHDVNTREQKPIEMANVDPHYSRLKPTYSDDTIKNNNTSIENHNENHPSLNSSQSKSVQQVQVGHLSSGVVNDRCNMTTSYSLSANASVTRQMSLVEDYIAVRTKSEHFGLTRSASEWSIEDPDKAEYCYINGEFKEQTHTALFKFVPRHEDEILLEINDPLHVVDQADDFWYEGINMRTGKRGIFPSYYAQSLLDLVDRLSDISIRVEPDEQFSVYFLGSVEVPSHKGNDVLCQAMHKVAQVRKQTIHTLPPAYVSLLVNSNGIKMMDHSLFRCLPDFENGSRCFSSSATTRQRVHFFHIQSVSFCGHHPKNNKYFAFISRHPRTHSRFACHVFVSERSTRPLAESIGRAFTSFFHRYVSNAHPAEDIYIE